MNRILAALVNGGILAAALTAMVWLALRIVPRRVLNAATRYALWWSLLAIAIAAPVLYLKPAAVPLPAVPSPVPSVALPAIPAPPVAIVAAPAPLTAEPRSTSLLDLLPAFPIEITASTWPRRILLAWLATAALLLLRLAASCILLARANGRAVIAPDALCRRAEHWMRLCGSRRRTIRIAGSAELAAPVAVGPLRPTILIPTRLLDTLDERELDQIGLHETAHLARGDDYAVLVQRFVEAVYALHPVVRWITRQIDLEREIACDDMVIAATGQARAYAFCLTRIAELSNGVRSALAAAPAADDRSHLARRIDILLDSARHSGTRLLKARLTSIVAAAAALTWIAGRAPGVVAFATPLVHKVAAAAPRALHLPALMPRAADPPPQPEASTFDARVIEDSTGNPLASAQVRFKKAGQRELAADLDTGRDGRILAPGLPPGEYTIEISKPNFVTESLKLRVPASGLVMRLVRYGILSGRVLNQQGQALPGRIHGPSGRTLGGTRVVVLVKSESGGFRVAREREPDEDGQYRVYDLPPGQYMLGLWYDGLKEGSGTSLYPDNAHPRTFAVAGGEEFRDLDFSITPQSVYQVSGKVQLPKPKTRFALALGLSAQPLLPISQTLTEEDGSFRFERVPPGDYDLFVAGPERGYGAHDHIVGPDPFFARTRVQVGGQNVTGLDIAVAPGKSLTVTLGAKGADKPPAGCPQSAGVAVELVEPWGIFSPTADANTQVAFGKEQIIRNLTPGRVRVTASGLGNNCFAVNSQIVDLAGETPAPVALEVASAGSIRGTLSGAEAHASSYTVVLLAADAAADSQAQLATPDPQGHFEFDALRPGRYRIAVQPAGAGTRTRWVADVTRMSEVAVAGGPPTEFELTAPKGANQ